ncbi:hypothetical protein MHYP_G00004140 [Metynnis hypsauchen]
MSTKRERGRSLRARPPTQTNADQVRTAPACSARCGGKGGKHDAYSVETRMQLQERLGNYLPLGETSARRVCEVCLSHFPVSHGGEHDVKRHRHCETHQKRVAQKEVSQSAHAFLLKPKQDSNVDKVTAAELTSVYHTVKLSPSYRSEDCGDKLTSTMFPDSAKKMSCGRTKAASIVTDVLAPASVESCLRELKTPVVQELTSDKVHTPFFSVASDASNHGTTKLFPLSLRYWTPQLGLKSKILDLYEDNHESAATIHRQITSKLEENGLQLDMISAYTADNANVNYGKNNSVFQKLKCLHSAPEELKAVFAFVEEDYHVVRRHVPTRWLSLWPAVQRLHDSWAAIKSYFLSLGEDQCPKALWQLLKTDQDGEGQPLELQAYLAFLNNILKIFHDVVLLLEGQDVTVYGTQLPGFNFTDNNYQKNVTCLALKSSFTFSQLSDAVKVLQIGGILDMDELCEEYCVTLPRQQEIVERKAPVVEKWAILLKSTKTPNLTAVASFLFSIPITNASVERVFSLMTAAWTDQKNCCSVELIKSEIQVKTNFEYSCKEFYSFALKQKALLEAARSSKKYKAKRNI